MSNVDNKLVFDQAEKEEQKYISVSKMFQKKSEIYTRIHTEGSKNSFKIIFFLWAALFTLAIKGFEIELIDNSVKSVMYFILTIVIIIHFLSEIINTITEILSVKHVYALEYLSEHFMFKTPEILSQVTGEVEKIMNYKERIKKEEDKVIEQMRSGINRFQRASIVVGILIRISITIMLVIAVLITL